MASNLQFRRLKKKEFTGTGPHEINVLHLMLAKHKPVSTVRQPVREIRTPQASANMRLISAAAGELAERAASSQQDTEQVCSSIRLLNS